ncbi:MAG: branched-chain amino acid transport system substrate-binding protein [Gaiellaceae bacterium]|nr:branched-chain amino acid transport system substrate-binding protein [Gaiellaceae bacterium]
MKKLIALALVASALVATALAVGTTRGESAVRASTGSGTTLLTCGKTRTIGLLAPITGPAASIGILQVKWADFYVRTYNASHKKTKFKLMKADTQLGGANGNAEALKSAQAISGSSKVLGVVGPAGSNEVKGTTAVLKGGGLAWVSGSATNTTLTTDGTRAGYFFRTVPPDSAQSKNVSRYIISTLKLKRVYIIDDQEAYSTGLADEVEQQLKAAGVTTTRDGVSQQQSDFSSLIAKIPRDTQLVYLPWQLPPKGQAFGQQMKTAGRGAIKLMGSDGLFDPAFASVGSNVYDSFFPVQPTDSAIKAYKRTHGGQGDYFGAPSYVAAQVVGGAIDRACKNGKATRAEVRGQIRKTNLKKTLLGLPVRFTAGGDLRSGSFGIYQSKNGDFARVG